MNKTVLLAIMLLIFTTGWLANDVYNKTQTVPKAIEKAKDFTTILKGLPEKPTPANRITENQIKVLQNQVIIEVPNAKWATFTPTHSMAPTFDQGANAIQIVPQTPNDIQTGDIVSYTWKDGTTIIHRVIQTGTDENGWYAILKGDNITNPDPEKVRFEQIKKVAIAIIY